jgi:DNA polymerase-1
MTIVTTETFDTHLQALKDALQGDSTLVVDVETNGLDSFGVNQICGVGVGQIAPTGLIQYYPFRHQFRHGENLDQSQLDDFIQVLNDYTNSLIGYNLKFDAHFLEKEGLNVSNKKLIDVIVMVRLIEHSDVKELGLTPTGRRNYGESVVKYDIDMKKELHANKWHKDFSMAPAEMLGAYCEHDVLLTARLYADYMKRIITTGQLSIFELECSLTAVLYSMENRGIKINKQTAIKTKAALLVRMDEVIKEIYELAGEEFNISSPMQIGKIFTAMGIFSALKTPKGKDSWNEAALVNINHRMAGLIRQYRTLDKLKSTYIDPYLEAAVMHTSFCNWGTSTGRLSSREPNLQNIPRNHFKLIEPVVTDADRPALESKISAMVSAKGVSLTEHLSNEVLKTWSFIGDESYDALDETQIAIRSFFVPRTGFSLLSFDYSQMEVRVFMSYFRNETIDALLSKEGVDFHGEAAKLAFGVDESSPQFKFYRQLAKAITFGTIYGIGNKKLSQQLGTSVADAGKYKQQYFAGMEGSKDFFDKVVDTVTKRGWIRNRYGRRYRINQDFAYKGVNYLVQGTSADILSERMIAIDKFLVDKQSKILLQVHDEIICEIHDSELGTLPFQIKELLEQNSLDIPLKVDMEICAPTWATKKDFTSLSFDDCIEWD